MNERNLKEGAEVGSSPGVGLSKFKLIGVE